MNATELRALLESAGLSQRGAARLLDIDERTMRRYCSGDLPIPNVIVLALRQVIDQKHSPERHPR